MELFDIIGIVIIVAAALKGGRRGFVVTLGRLCAGILSLLLVYLLNTWAFALKTIILSLRILTGLPIIKGLNKLLGFVAGAAYGLLLVGILGMIQDVLPIF